MQLNQFDLITKLLEFLSKELGDSAVITTNTTNKLIKFVNSLIKDNETEEQ